MPPFHEFIQCSPNSSLEESLTDLGERYIADWLPPLAPMIERVTFVLYAQNHPADWSS